MKINYQEFFESKHSGDYGAVIVITNEQIVETINLYNGAGNHNETIKKIIDDIYDLENSTSKEKMHIMAELIRIKLVSEHGMKLIAIEFPLGRKINLNQYKLLKKWCVQNRDIIKKISNNLYGISNNHKLIVIEKNGTDVYLDDLYSILEYAKNLVFPKHIISDVNILSEEYTPNNNNKRRCI